ncbi:DUF2497 domain-containing protein [Tsuneonella deserti]|nr:DUF2497 domain-containing protein [Tsuneonella deserti]
MRQDGEASVEEILESIKKVIARDNRASAFETRRRRENEGLSDSLPEPVDAEEAGEVLDLAAADYVEQAAEYQDAETSDDIHDADRDKADDEDLVEDGPLVTEAARVSMRHNLAALAMLAEPGVPPQIVRSGETSLEGLTRDLLRPMLSEWLDKHLPDMVERLVKDEIARIAGKRG